MSNPINKERMIEKFLEYVTVASESFHEKEFCLVVENELKEMGYPVIRDENAGKVIGSDGWNIYTKIEGEDKSLAPIMLSAHLDTVQSGVGIKPVIDGDIIKSSGDTILASDDKSGIAIIMELLRYFHETGTKPQRTVEVYLTICEEAGLLGSKNADMSMVEAKMGVSLDYAGSDLGALTARSPSIERMYFTINGKPAHAALCPEEGVNAIATAVDAMSKIPQGHVDDITVMNIGELSAPNQGNVVSHVCKFVVELRSFTMERTQHYMAQTEETVKAACEKTGATYDLNVVEIITPAIIPEDSEVFVHSVKALEKVGITPNPVTIFGGSDATHFFAKGIPSFCISTGMENCHGLNEYIPISLFKKASDLVWELCN